MTYDDLVIAGEEIPNFGSLNLIKQNVCLTV